MISKALKTTLLSAAIAAFITGCGGSSNNSSQLETNITGRAVDGPLAGSTVLFSDCDNQTTTTDESGFFKFPEGCLESEIVISGGVDTATDLPFSGELKAPPKTPVPGVENKVFVSPITTLIAAAPTVEAQQALTEALGLSGKDLLSIDPMEDRDVYAKSVAVQQIVEQIEKAVATLGGTSSQSALNSAAVTALTAALTATPNASNVLTNAATIKAAIVNTVTAVEQTLPTELKNNAQNVANNLGTLTASVIATNTQTIVQSINQLPTSAFNGSVESVKQETKTVVTDVKQSVAIEKVVSVLAPALISEPTTNLTEQLQKVSEAVAVPSTAPTTTIADAVTAIKTETNVTIDENASSIIENANSFYSDYLLLSGFNVQSVNYSIEQLNTSISSPITKSSLNNILVGISSTGILKEETIEVPAVVELAVGSKVLSIKATTLRLTFDTNGVLTAAVIPSNSNITITSTLNTISSTSFNLTSEVNALSNGKIALNAATLNLISSSLNTQLSSLENQLKGKVVNVTAILGSTNPIAISTSALATKYTVAGIQGFGVTAKFNIQ